MSQELHELLSDPVGRMNRQYGNAALEHEIPRSPETTIELIGKSLSKLAISSVHLKLQISLAHDDFSEGRQALLQGVVNK